MNSLLICYYNEKLCLGKKKYVEIRKTKFDSRIFKCFIFSLTIYNNYLQQYARSFLGCCSFLIYMSRDLRKKLYSNGGNIYYHIFNY